MLLYNIAMFVSAALNHALPACNGKGMISTIRVHQYKTKFSQIRIYCTLADKDLVLEKWISQGKEGEPTRDFIKMCCKRDSSHYRECYLSMLSLLKDEQHISSLRESADYPELLFTSDAQIENFLENKKNNNSLQYYFDKYFVDGPDELRDYLHDIHGLSI